MTPSPRTPSTVPAGDVATGVAGARPPAEDVQGRIVQLRAAGVHLVLDCRGPLLPSVLHWGPDLGQLSDAALDGMARASAPPVVPNTVDEPAEHGLLLEHARGWLGRPGLSGHRDGADWSPLFAVESVTLADGSPAGGALSVSARDAAADLGLSIELVLEPSGLIRMRAAVRNLAAAAPYSVEALTLGLPVPGVATELFDLAGRWSRERAPQRQPFNVGSRVRENWSGRTGADASLVLAAGSPGFGFRSGQVWAIHVGWSGNHRTYAERLRSGETVLSGGELLLPGELRLGPGDEYASPWIYASYGTGLDGVADRFHAYLRARDTHPVPARPRPVILNTWEAVYFDHDLTRLKQLADAAAEVGVERYVLDDGWFRHRRSDNAGLGDWYVDEEVWPDGLHPLVDHVRGLGMEFGLWVEPEMVNPDSDLARAHPDWILATGGRMPLPSRRQQVLDLGNPDAYAYILERLDALLTEYDIAYLKWDHNRDLVDAGHGPRGVAGVHAQTLAVYRLLDELRSRHPHIEIESCAGGGGRVDLGILQRTDRVWASDCIDALERQHIQRWTEMLLPPELIGSHVGSPRAHTTSRMHDLSFRAGTALFCHFGIEWDLTKATAEDRQELSGWIALYKELRPLLHSGRVVRADSHDPALWVHGVVSADARDAVFALVATGTSLVSPPGRVRLPGLAPDLDYRVQLLPPGDQAVGLNHVPARWLTETEVTLRGRVLEEVGVQAPAQHPEHLILLRLKAQ